MMKTTRAWRILVAACPIWIAGMACPQVPVGPDLLQQKVQALQKAGAENEQRLRNYQWLETTTITVNGKTRPPRQSICRYAPDGVVVKTPLGPPPAPPMPSGGPLKRRIEGMKIEEMKESMAEVQGLVTRYLPLNREAFRGAMKTRRIDFEHDGDRGNSIIVNGYVKPGDKFILGLNMATMQMRSVRVESYFASPADTLTAAVQFSALPDGTSYPGVVTINAPARRVAITTVQSNFSRIAE